MPSSRFVDSLSSERLDILSRGDSAWVFYGKGEFADGTQETLNFWKQLTHVMKYFRPEEDPGAKLPPNFITGFLEGRN